jgi:hypothetical protein
VETKISDPHLFNVDADPYQLFTSPRIVNLLIIKMMQIYDYLPSDPPGLHF